MCQPLIDENSALNSVMSSALSLTAAIDAFADEYGLAILRGAPLSSSAAGEFASIMRTSSLLESAMARLREK